MSALLVVALSAIALGSSKEDSRLVIPDDQSLSVEEYLEQGVPDPAISWSATEYKRALEQLSKIKGRELPRTGSDQSGLVFQRLLITQLDVPDMALEGDGPTLADLYGLHRADRLLFDRELVAIRTSRLEAIIAKIPSVDEMRAAERDVSALYERAASQKERAHRAETLQVYSELPRQFSEMLRDGVMRLLYLISLKELGAGARSDVVAEMSALVPLFKGRLVDTDLETIAHELRGLSRLDCNDEIANELGDLATRVQDLSAR